MYITWGCPAIAAPGSATVAAAAAGYAAGAEEA